MNPAISTLAEKLLQASAMDGTADITDIYEALKPALTHRNFLDLGLALELCPQHYCDIQICLDDQVHGCEVYSQEVPDS